MVENRQRDFQMKHFIDALLSRSSAVSAHSASISSTALDRFPAGV